MLPYMNTYMIYVTCLGKTYGVCYVGAPDCVFK